MRLRLKTKDLRVEVLACILLSALIAATANAAEKPGAQGKLRVSVNAVEFDVTAVRAKDGEPVEGLNAGDFSLTEDGIPQTITYISQNRLPLSIVFLFDLTDTVRPVLQHLASGARQVLGHLRPSDEVAVMAFSSRTWLLQDFTTDHDKAMAAIYQASEMRSGEDTFLNEDMYEALQEAANATIPHSRHVLVWLTDGTVNPPAWKGAKKYWKSAPARLHSEKEAINALLHSDVTVAGLIERSAASDAALVGERLIPVVPILWRFDPPGNIHKYAKLTGGPILISDKAETMDRLVELLDRIRLRYTIGYSSSLTRPSGTFCKISLKPTHETQRRFGKLVIHTRRGYYR